ncbi:hypothetical protein FS837_001319, partial [Tulasnella sp. UAMH 9824]
MSDLPLTGPDEGKSSPKPDVPPPTGEVHALQAEDVDETESHMRMGIEESKKVKLYAEARSRRRILDMDVAWPQRDLLSKLSDMRISTTEIKFMGNGYQATGTYGNVAIATFVKAGIEEQGRRVAVKMLRS